VQIRPAGPDDADAIASVHVASWQAAYRGLMPDAVLDGLSVERRADMWRQILAPGRTGHVVLVAAGEDGTGMSGFAHGGPGRDADLEPGTAELFSIYLLPGDWGRGAGRALMDGVLEGLGQQGYTAAVLWVLVGNDRARRFYEIAGWSGDGNEKSEEFGGAVLTETRYRCLLGNI
jgi:ribosomal protein S18 acetylase RimI-like enzyme